MKSEFRKICCIPVAVAYVGLAIATPALRAQAGLLDGTFGNAGKVLTKNANNFGQAVNVAAIQSDGKIVVAGSLNGNFGFVRYTTRGGLDSAFGSGGIVSMSPGESAVDVILGIVIQSDGKILAAGPANAGNDFFVIRLNANGSLDTTFGNSGIAGILGGSGIGCIPNSGAVAAQPNGGLLVVGGCVMRFEAGSDIWHGRSSQAG